jgi:hypothetical protein
MRMIRRGGNAGPDLRHGDGHLLRGITREQGRSGGLSMQVVEKIRIVLMRAANYEEEDGAIFISQTAGLPGWLFMVTM